MDISSIPLETFAGQGLFALLFVWLLFDTRREAKAREETLLNQVDRQNEQMGRIVNSLERLEQQITSMKGE
ncbi:MULTISPECIES: BhlA/UviB family holin-like peptide [Peribacillus]|uniref:BhlA/UviB family holin-like peptide n=1 Tax=Peribacillus TaxID=2675229 RepID=UPI00207B04B0|nr:BhlA/UviB family holin-like peptide [Peribacillus asahii]USK86159.1 holin [Peribacillus asahii]